MLHCDLNYTLHETDTLTFIDVFVVSRLWPLYDYVSFNYSRQNS
jgi:hypothetical protein